jgi:hypothetical protein
MFCISTLPIKIPWISLVSLLSGHARPGVVSLHSSRDVIRRRLRVGARTTRTEDRKHFGCMSHKCKVFWISTGSIKIVCILPLEMQNLLDFIGHGGSGSCTTSLLTADLCRDSAESTRSLDPDDKEPNESQRILTRSVEMQKILIEGQLDIKYFRSRLSKYKTL